MTTHKRTALFLACNLIIAGVAPRTYASASILGFSVGEENYTLAGILSQAIQQVKFLSDLATMTRVMKENISFIKDVYGTANDIATGNWQQLTEDRAWYNDYQARTSRRIPLVRLPESRPA